LLVIILALFTFVRSLHLRCPDKNWEAGMAGHVRVFIMVPQCFQLFIIMIFLKKNNLSVIQHLEPHHQPHRASALSAPIPCERQPTTSIAAHERVSISAS